MTPLQSEQTFKCKQIIIPSARREVDANIRVRYPIEQAAWIWHPDCRVDDVAVLRFTNTFEVSQACTVILHVSADQRYELYLNNQRISTGPHRSDLAHWSFSSCQLQLTPGKHTLSAQVWWIGDHAPVAQISIRGGFICAAKGMEDQLNTGSGTWRVQQLQGWSFAPSNILPVYHAIGDSQQIDGSIWFSQNPPAVKPSVIVPPLKTTRTGIIQGLWRVEPTPLPQMLHQPICAGKIRAITDQSPHEHPLSPDACQSEPIASWQALLDHQTPVTLEPHTTTHVVWDLEEYYCGYSCATLSGGLGSTLQWQWAESFYELKPDGSRSWHKGNRNDIENKKWLGFGDVFCQGGQDDCDYQSYWWRAGRYILLSITTADEPLRIDRLSLLETRYPLENKSKWKSADASLDAVIPLAVRGMQMCAHETYMDCPYYEQLMYVGDSRLEMLVQYIMTDDDRLTRRGIQLFDESRQITGFVAERYPSTPFQQSLTFAMLWVSMVRDYTWWRHDRLWARDRLVGVRNMLEQFLLLLNEDHLLERLPGWSFIDWSDGWDAGYSADGESGINSINNLLFVQALNHAAQIEDWVGEPIMAERYRQLAAQTSLSLVKRFWDAERHCLADDLAHEHFSEHAQCLALLNDVLDAKQCAGALRALLEAPDLARTTVYFSHYLFETFYKFRKEQALFEKLNFWRHLNAQGFKTPVEKPEPSRSDCHAWGSHPLYHLHASLAGIRPDAQGFERVRIAPMPGGLSSLKSELPHPKGRIQVQLEFEAGTQRCHGWVCLPADTPGTFVWQNQEIPLLPGKKTTVDMAQSKRM